MNKLFLLDGQTEGILAVLQNDSSKKCPFFVGIHTEQLNKDHTFELSVPADHEAAAHVKENNLVLFKDVDGEYQLFQIYKTEEEHDGSQLTTKAYAEHTYFEMVDDIIEDLRTINDTADSAMTDALSQSRFKKGIVANLGLRTTNFYYESAVSSIQKIIETWGGELKKRIYFDGNKITGRFVDLLSRRGADTGKRFELGKDLLSVKRTIISQPKTALYGRGKGEETETGGFTRRITFADEVWNASGVDPVDKPIGQEWVGDPEALERFGRIDPETGQKKHRVGVFEDGEETDPAALLQKTWDYLQTINTPKVTYEMSVLDLEEVAGLSHEKVRLGDTVYVIDKEFTPALRVEARVIEIRRNLAEPENTEVILGNFLPMFTDLSSRLKSVESKLDGKEGVWDGVQDPIDDTDFVDMIPAKPNVTASGAFSKVIIEWDADLSSYVKEYEVYVSAVPNFTPDLSNLVARANTSVFVYEGDPNQQYYIRVRGMNRAGTPGPFSDQDTATTARITAGDITPQIITNELIALNANIDGAKIADATIGRAKIGSVNADVIDTGILNASRIDVRAQLGANISTAEELKYGYMQATTLNGERWYKYGSLPSWIYLIEESDPTKYNRPIPDDGDEVAFDFLLYAQNSGTAPALTMTIRVYFEDGTSWLDTFTLSSIVSVPANTVKRVQLYRKIPENAYSGRKPTKWVAYFYTSTTGTNLYVKDTDVRIRLRGNLIVQGDIEAKYITAWEGLNVNNQFFVENGNVKFSGTLEAGVSINSPVINSAVIYLYGTSARLHSADTESNPTEVTDLYNGSLIQRRYETPGDAHKVRSTTLTSGSLKVETGTGLRGLERAEYVDQTRMNLLPYEYKYSPGKTQVTDGLLASGVASFSLNNPQLTDGNGNKSITGYPMYIHADRLGIGTTKNSSTDPEYEGLIFDIRDQYKGANSALLTSPEGMEFRILNGGFFDFNDTVRIYSNSDLFQLYGTDHAYMEFFKNGGISRSGYFGYGSSVNDAMTLRNEISGGELLLYAGAGAAVKIPSNDLVVRSTTYTSDSELKREIADFQKSALNEILSVPIKEYYFYDDKPDIDLKRIGILLQDAPVELATPTGSIDSYAMDAFSWKAIQELYEMFVAEINELKTIIEGMNPNEPDEPTNPTEPPTNPTEPTN